MSVHKCHSIECRGVQILHFVYARGWTYARYTCMVGSAGLAWAACHLLASLLVLHTVVNVRVWRLRVQAPIHHNAAKEMCIGIKEHQEHISHKGLRVLQQDRRHEAQMSTRAVAQIIMQLDHAGSISQCSTVKVRPCAENSQLTV